MEQKKKFMKIAVASLLVMVLFISSALVMVMAASLSDIQNEINDKMGQQDSIDDQLSNLEDQKKAEKKAMEEKSKTINSLVNQKESAMTDKEKAAQDVEESYKAILEIQQTIEDAEKEYAEAVKLFLVRSRVMQQNAADGNDYAILELFLESKDLLSFFDRSNAYQVLMEKDRALLQELENMKLDLDLKKELATEDLADAEALLSEKQALVNKIMSDQNVAEKDYAKSKAAIEKIEKMEEELDRKSKELEKQIKKLQEESAKIKYEGGKMLWPAEKGTYISSYFGMRTHPITKKYKMHNGIDIPAPNGSNILAANAGTVILAAYHSSYGNYIIVDHGGGISTLYAHASKLKVSVGTKVSRGDVIALVGTTGSSTGYHLHFEVRESGTPVNPLNYLKA